MGKLSQTPTLEGVPLDPSTPPLLPADLAKRWGVSTKTLANWRAAGEGPRFSRIGPRRPIYLLEDVIAYERSQAA